MGNDKKNVMTDGHSLSSRSPVYRPRGLSSSLPHWADLYIGMSSRYGMALAFSMSPNLQFLDIYNNQGEGTNY